MFSYEILQDCGVIVLVATGETTTEDYMAVAPQLMAEIRSQDIRKFLQDYREHKGWASEEAWSFAFSTWMETRSQFDRIALVSHYDNRKEATELVEFYRNDGTEVRQFPPTQYEAALDWLKDDRAANKTC